VDVGLEKRFFIRQEKQKDFKKAHIEKKSCIKEKSENRRSRLQKRKEMMMKSLSVCQDFQNVITKSA
jgi:hypothetical protein